MSESTAAFSLIRLISTYQPMAMAATSQVDTSGVRNPGWICQVPVEVECASLDDVVGALDAGVPRLLLDNMTPDQLRQAVKLAAGAAKLEASGGVTLDNVREVAETGVDFISVGALTHSAPALDFSLLLDPLE